MNNIVEHLASHIFSPQGRNVTPDSGRACGFFKTYYRQGCRRYISSAIFLVSGFQSPK